MEATEKGVFRSGIFFTESTSSCWSTPRLFAVSSLSRPFVSGDAGGSDGVLGQMMCTSWLKREMACSSTSATWTLTLLAVTETPVTEPALEMLRLVGADSDEDRCGIVGGKSIVRTDPSDSEYARLRREGRSKTGPELELVDDEGE
jgi:hypothetical protein